jgi:hypothetical protein
MAENFDLIFGQNASQQYAWSDSDYQEGWETVGNIPPTAAQFDALQRRNDMKTKELNDNLTPLVNANTAETRQPATAYNEGDMKYSPLLPTGWFLSCVVAGTTSAGEIVLPSPVVENATVTDGTVVWKIRTINQHGVPLGVILPLAHNGTIPAGYLECDGSAVSRTLYADLYAAIGTLYGIGDGSTTFNIPDVEQAQKFLQGDSVAGTAKNAGLPNIKGTFGRSQSGASTISPLHGGNTATGAFSLDYNTYSVLDSPSGSMSNPQFLNFNASSYNSIYSDSVITVQPSAITSRFIIRYE